MRTATWVFALMAASWFLSSAWVYSQEDDHEFMPADAWLWMAETGEDDATTRLAEGFEGQKDFPTKSTLIEPVDGDGGFDNVAPQLLADRLH